MESTNFDTTAFRQALGSFATGVTIITTRDSKGEPLGLTVNSFNSVSLDPPLVLWSLAKSALSLPVFREAEHWAVHVLSSGQSELSTRFAMRGEDKFAGLDVDAGVGEVPLLKDCTARFQCKTAFQYDGGDHVIFVGEVVSFDRSDVAPLVFHGGKYAHATPRTEREGKPRRPYLGGSFNDDFLGYLLGRSHFKFYGRIKPLLKAEELSDEEFYVLSTLTLKHEMSAEDMDKAMRDVLDEAGHEALDSLCKRGYVSQKDEVFHLTDEGSRTAIRLITSAKAVESTVTERMGYEEGAVLKSLLNKLLDTLDPEAAEMWEYEPN